MDKFAGVGLVNLFLIWLVMLIFSLIAKVVLTKYPVDGLSQIVIAGA